MSRRPLMLFTGEFWAGASARGLSDGFRDLGWAVQEVDQRDFGVKRGKSPVLRIASRLTRRMAEEAYRARLLEECRVLKPDIFLTVKGVGITADFLQEVRRAGAKTVMYFPDFHFDHPGVSVESFAGYDLFVTTKTFQLDYLENLLGPEHVAYVPHGFSGCVHEPVYSNMPESDFEADVLHAGNHSAWKQRWLEGAAAALPDASFRVVGNSWRENAGGGPLARSDMPGPRLGIGYAGAIQAARINIAVHFGPTASGWEDRVSTRTFEIPACKGFMLHIDNEEVRAFFEPGVEIDVFSTPEELADKIGFYLARPELRAQMIERAYARCVPAYSYAARAKQIADQLETI
ncbi:glycosyltransferase [Hoeflea sp.]|uniref:CgeB family protein n=1 Tax=Hoeflea sp. TaxID=1940281 RepID=UPI0019A399EB|nr:glycosyltransferase [Hoeflea sp.]MBC7284828.1 glycosyltransferase [Hoeflea sp.]